MQLLVQAAGVADVAAVGVLPPQRRLGGQTVCAEDAAASAPLWGETDGTNQRGEAEINRG